MIIWNENLLLGLILSDKVQRIRNMNSATSLGMVSSLV